MAGQLIIFFPKTPHLHLTEALELMRLSFLSTRKTKLVHLCLEASAVTTSPLLFPESELITEPEEEEEKDTKEAEGEHKEEEGGGNSLQSVDCPSLAECKV